MNWFRCTSPALLGIGLILTSANAFAIAGTDKIASAGQPVQAQPNWPQGLVELLNNPARTDGWRDWFSEWPNDVVHYQFRAGDVNALLAKFAAIQSDRLQVHLAPYPEPRGFGWTSKLPPGSRTPLMLSFGDQQQLNEWYERLDGRKFGQMEFEKAPIAVPPTLTIFTRNDAIDLGRLEIPRNVKISVGGIPGPFYEANLKPRPEERKQDATPVAEADPAAVEAQKEIERIHAFLKKRDKAPAK